eukprot:UN31801
MKVDANTELCGDIVTDLACSPIEDVDTCQMASAQLELADVTAGTTGGSWQDRVPAGCYYQESNLDGAAGLWFNSNLESTTDGVEFDDYQICYCQADTENNCEPDNTCVNGTCVDEVDGYRCDCDAGFEGRDCEENINECDLVDCNNGTCIDEVNGYHCVCDAGFDGRDCDENINECEFVSCNNGTCVDEINGYHCVYR